MIDWNRTYLIHLALGRKGGGGTEKGGGGGKVGGGSEVSSVIDIQCNAWCLRGQENGREKGRGKRP